VIDPRTTLGQARLIVRSLDAVLPFYTDVLGLKVQRREEGPEGRRVALGAGRHDLLRLSERPDAPREERSAGMYHLALRVEQRADLARWLRRILETGTPVEGLVDHSPASEAIYLPDPEGNTVELNWDRPREVWSRPGQPPFRGNLPLDTDGLLALVEGEAGGGAGGGAWAGAPPDTAFSHVHLYVGELAPAERFYEGVLGFERTAAFPGQAVFVSAGGYHHHVAFNIWKGRGIPPREEGAAGLEEYVVRVPDEAEVGRVAERARTAGVALSEGAEDREAGGGIRLRDPAGVGVVVSPHA
jgi:catechol 2,3-dioxygenase